jgi:hypothetical protein
VSSDALLFTPVGQSLGRENLWDHSRRILPPVIFPVPQRFCFPENEVPPITCFSPVAHVSLDSDSVWQQQRPVSNKDRDMTARVESPVAEVFSGSGQNYPTSAIHRRFNAVLKFFDENCLALSNFRPLGYEHT